MACNFVPSEIPYFPFGRFMTCENLFPSNT